ncbi:MAG: hypothetical protein ACPG5O_10060 [Pseudoalteromonas tetraodonis]
MALVTRGTTASIDAIQGQKAPYISALVAGEALDALAPCYVKSDGKVYMSNGTSNNAAAKCHGFTPTAYASGAPVSLYGPGTRAEYGSGLTPGAPLYVGATAGRLDASATTGGLVPVAIAVNAREIVITALTA